MDSFCRELPKIELHAHLNGSLSRSTLKKLGCLEEAVSKYQTYYDQNQISMEEVFHLFKIAHNATSTKQALYIATKSVIEEFAADNVIYLELRTTPREEKDMTEQEYIETVLKAMDDTRHNDILVKLLLSLDRRRTFAQQEKTMNTIIEYKRRKPLVIRGVDLSGNPAEGMFHKELFEKAREQGLLTTIHCAEIKNHAEVEKILSFKPDRIGHGTFMHPNYGGTLKIWEMYEQLKTPLECCLTSNVICKTSKSYKEHHVQEWIKNELPFCLSTDDKGIFNITLSKEYQYAQESFNLNKMNLWKMSRKSIDYTFASDKEKTELELKMNTWRIDHLNA